MCNMCDVNNVTLISLLLTKSVFTPLSNVVDFEYVFVHSIAEYSEVITGGVL